MISEICGMTPEACTLRRKISPYRPSETKLSWILDAALLEQGAGALVDADDRAAGLDREVHHLGDLLAVHLAERAAEDREVLGEDADLAAVDRAVAGDDAVAVGAPLLQPERRGAVPRQLV